MFGWKAVEIEKQQTDKGMIMMIIPASPGSLTQCSDMNRARCRAHLYGCGRGQQTAIGSLSLEVYRIMMHLQAGQDL
jgi:hypothetical protein